MRIAPGHTDSAQHVIAQIQPVVPKLGRHAELRHELPARPGCDIESRVGTILRVYYRLRESAAHVECEFIHVLRRRHPRARRHTTRRLKQPLRIHGKSYSLLALKASNS